MFDFLRSHELQHARLLYLPLSPGVCSNSCPLNQRCYLTILSSAIPCFCLHFFPASGSFPMNQLFASGGQNVGASASVLPKNIHGWFPLELTGLISFQSKGLKRLLQHSAFFMVQNHYRHWQQLWSWETCSLEGKLAEAGEDSSL